MSLLTLLILLVIACLVYWVIHQLAGAFGLPAPIVVVCDVILVIVVVWYLLGLLTGHPLRLQ